jgi:hypothetical protein
MHAILGCQLGPCAIALHGFQRHAGLEPCIMVPAFLHVLISSFLETSRRQIQASITDRFSGRDSDLEHPLGALKPAFKLTDFKHTDQSGWDRAVLAPEHGDLQDMVVDLTNLKFEAPELD